MADDYILRWRTLGASWRTAKGFDQKSAETRLDIDRRCLTGPLALEVVYPDGSRRINEYDPRDV